jgi:hypothetical protein
LRISDTGVDSILYHTFNSEGNQATYQQVMAGCLVAPEKGHMTGRSGAVIFMVVGF